MKKILCVLLAAILLLGCLPVTALAAENFPVYRLYNPYSGEHLMSTNQKEIQNLTAHGWSVDGVAWYSVSDGETVYRLFNPYDGSHLYTMNQTEIKKCLSLGWLMDGPVSYSETKEKGTPIYRLFNPYADAHYHLYTVNPEEISKLTSLGWIKEGIAWYAAGTHVHKFGTEWKSDDTHHWHECPCGEKSDYAEHAWGDWDILSEPEKDENGWKERVCSVCHAVEGEEIPALEHQHNWSEFVKGDLVESHNYFNTYKWISTCSECGETRSKTVDEATSYPDTVASEMVASVNSLRAEHGLRPLWTSEEWNSWASARAKQLQRDFSHNGAEHAIGNQKVCAENITADNALNYGDQGDSLNGANFYRSFYESQPHLANMLIENAHGIAVAVDYDLSTGSLTCAMVIIYDHDQYMEDENMMEPDFS